MRTGIVIAGLIVGLYAFYPAKSVTYGPGLVAPDEPTQERLTGSQGIPMNGYELTPLARFDITARILSTHTYSYGRESELSPIDRALGWGRMSDEAVLDQISLSQGGRWLNWKARDLPIPSSEISSHAANMHMIPANSAIDDQLSDVFKGQVVHLSGYLVRARASDGWTWTSSLSRTDSGSRACEVFFVERLIVVKGDE